METSDLSESSGPAEVAHYILLNASTISLLEDDAEINILNTAFF